MVTHFRSWTSSFSIWPQSATGPPNPSVLGRRKYQTRSRIRTELVFAWIDPQVLRQTVINVLDNAIKFSPEGARIRISVAEREDVAVLAVTDSGPGISPEHVEHVFERFYRVDAARSRQTGGAGLGLAIARWGVETNGGRIELETESGRGSTFRLILPRSPVSKAGAG